MIPANKKRSFTEVPESLTAQLEKTLGTENEIQAENSEKEDVKPETELIKTVTKSEEKKSSKKNDRNGQINICVPPETKTAWKLLFTKNNVNITQGIIFAVEHLKNEIESGSAILTVGGVIEKNK